MFVFVVRHAWAYEFGDARWPDDTLRELEPEGTERFAKLVDTLAYRGFQPDVIATSPYMRCRQTAEIISRHTPERPLIVELEALAPGSDFRGLAEWTNDLECQQVCWVGHAPDVGHLTAALVGDRGASIRFAKGAVAAVRTEHEVDVDCGELYWQVTAKVLGL